MRPKNLCTLKISGRVLAPSFHISKLNVLNKSRVNYKAVNVVTIEALMHYGYNGSFKFEIGFHIIRESYHNQNGYFWIRDHLVNRNTMLQR